MHRYALLPLIAAILCLPSCSQNASTGDPYRDTATDICACSGDYVTMSRQLARYQREGNTRALDSLRDEAVRIRTDFSTCMGRVAEKRGKEMVVNPRTRAVLDTVCPDLSNVIRGKTE